MTYSNAEKQRRYRQRLREQGRVQVQGWVTPDQAEVIRRIMAEGSERGVTPRPEQRAERNHP
jgi:hypothetical protein